MDMHVQQRKANLSIMEIYIHEEFLGAAEIFATVYSI